MGFGGESETVIWAWLHLTNTACQDVLYMTLYRHNAHQDVLYLTLQI